MEYYISIYHLTHHHHLYLIFVDCPAGAYLPSTGSLSCDSCPHGSISSSAGSTSCSACPAGSYSSPSQSLSPSSLSAPSTGLQLYYRFDAASVSGSRVGNSASGSVVFDATLQNGAAVSNNQLLLSAASSQYMEVDPFTTGTTGLTFATWWRSDNSGDWARIFDFSNGVAADNILITKPSSNNYLSVHIWKSSANYILTTSFNLNNGNAWNHLAWTLDPAGSGTWVIYINGAQVVSQAGPYPSSILRSNNFLGKSNWNSDSYLNGGIKDFRMYSRVLSVAEVSTLFTSTQTIFIGASQCLSCPAGQSSSEGSSSCFNISSVPSPSFTLTPTTSKNLTTTSS